jgi:coenzyme F420-0:L-glutamate ligase/coenzyme F420-1:gamma-L-glutamate ligase
VVPLKKIIRIPSLQKMMERRTGDRETMMRGYQENNAFTFIVKKFAAYLDEAGIDHTNTPGDYVSLLPEDPCLLAGEIREGIRQHFGAEVAVILTDTATSIGKLGSQDVAIGYSGIDPVTRQTFNPDLFGVPRAGGIDLIIDSIAGMAGLVMGQTIEKTPIVVVRGVAYQPERADELPGMEAVSLPAGTEWKCAVLTILATLRLWVGNLVSFQPRTKKSRVR